MSQRFFVETPITGEEARLQGPEAHHLTHVMRAKAGQRVVLFDGSGREFQAEVSRISRSEVMLEVLSSSDCNRELDGQLSFAVALPKGDRARYLVEKLTEIGVSRLVPLVTQRSVARPTDGALERLRRTVIEASKQCGRNRLMEITAAQPWQQWAQAASDSLKLFAHPDSSAPESRSEAAGTASTEVMSSEGASDGQSETGDPQDDRPYQAAGPIHWTTASVAVAIGPEGGFTADEASLAQRHDWRPVRLGPRILRVETAALVMAAQLATHGSGPS
jgi:16S rRNA (uracil1498-N3)-methyltransferase